MSSGWIFVWLPVLLILTWLANAVVVSEISGWRALSLCFTANAPPSGTALPEHVLGIGPGPGLVRALNRRRTRLFRILPSTSGLYLDAGSPHRFRWPPLLIPWNNVRVTSQRNILGSESFELCLGRSSVYVTVTPQAFRDIAPFLTASAAQQAVEAAGRTSS